MREKIIKLIAEAANIDPSEVKPEMEFVKDLGINSVEFAELAFSCEDVLDIEFDDKKLKKIIKVSDLFDYIAKLGITE